MKNLTATQAKNSFGMLLDWARQEPVLIKKQGRKVAVILSIEEYQRLSTPEKFSANLDDRDLTLAEKLAMLKSPKEERANILKNSVEKILSHYAEDKQRQDLEGGDFIDY
ncbi:MAG: type II toxin-antitoxin system Phd/YefM family antitoxin [Cyanobacterium sp.]